MGQQKSEKELEAPPLGPEDYVLHLPRPLNIEEKKYLLAVERGDLANVKRFIRAARNGSVDGNPVDVNCVDSLGRTALTLAIESENLEMVELLIVMGVETKDGLLHAIDQEFVEAVELLLEHEELLTLTTVNDDPSKEITHSWQRVDQASARYPPEMTPLILAAQRDNYEILKLLLDRGATLPMPHDTRCGCEDCLRSTTADPLRLSSTRISEYKALASPSLIALSSTDPLFTAFQLSWELRGLTIAEPESRAEYLKLRRQVEKFAVDLLQQVRTTTELNTILNYDPDEERHVGTARQLARLELAIQYKQKRFVAHPHIQQLLAAMWYDGVPGFRRMSTIQRLGHLAKTAILFPFYCIVYFVAPESRTGELMRRPFMKFLVHASSYTFFLFVLMLVSQRVEVELVRLVGNEEARRNLEAELLRQRGAAPTPLEGVVVLYVLGYIWQEAREVYVDGLKAYLRDLWNFIDFTRNFLYIGTGVLRLAAYLTQRREIEADPMAALVPRESWSDFDPQLIAEGLFAAANIFSALKLVHLFSVNPHLGPLQISLGRMVIDIVKFFFIYTLVLFSFACGLNQLLWYFAELERRKCYSGIGDPSWDPASDACLRWRRFSNLFESCQSLFWASFGGIGIESFELTGIKSYTRFWGLLMFGSYSVINVIVLLNLLIAMMSNSYAVIEEHADTEWKFARTKLWMSYFEEGDTLPAPFNILPTPKLLLRLCGLRRRPAPRRGSERRQANGHKYGAVMRALIWRYVVNAHSEHDMEPVTEDDVHELKSDLSSWRCELLDILGRNGMDISGVNTKGKTVLGKRMKVWERRLMKDFQVAGPGTTGEDTETDLREEESLQRPPEGEDHVARWKRIARLAVLRSPNHRWAQVVNSAVKSSQIGRSNSKASLQNQQSLRLAMEEARTFANKSPLPPVSPVKLPESTAATILHVLQDIVETDDNEDKPPKVVPPTFTVSPESNFPPIAPEPVTSVGYIDEKPKSPPAPLMPLRTPPRVIKRKNPGSLSPNSTRHGRPRSRAAASGQAPIHTGIGSRSQTGSPPRTQSRHVTSSSFTDVCPVKTTAKSGPSPRRLANGLNASEDRRKLAANVPPRSPRISGSRSPKKGGWL